MDNTKHTVRKHSFAFLIPELCKFHLKNTKTVRRRNAQVIISSTLHLTSYPLHDIVSIPIRYFFLDFKPFSSPVMSIFPTNASNASCVLLNPFCFWSSIVFLWQFLTIVAQRLMKCNTELNTSYKGGVGLI